MGYDDHDERRLQHHAAVATSHSAELLGDIRRTLGEPLRATVEHVRPPPFAVDLLGVRSMVSGVVDDAADRIGSAIEAVGAGVERGVEQRREMSESLASVEFHIEDVAGSAATLVVNTGAMRDTLEGVAASTSSMAHSTRESAILAGELLVVTRASGATQALLLSAILRENSRGLSAVAKAVGDGTERLEACVDKASWRLEATITEASRALQSELNKGFRGLLEALQASGRQRDQMSVALLDRVDLLISASMDQTRAIEKLSRLVGQPGKVRADELCLHARRHLQMGELAAGSTAAKSALSHATCHSEAWLVLGLVSLRVGGQLSAFRCFGRARQYAVAERDPYMTTEATVAMCRHLRAFGTPSDRVRATQLLEQTLADQVADPWPLELETIRGPGRVAKLKAVRAISLGLMNDSLAPLLIADSICRSRLSEERRLDGLALTVHRVARFVLRSGEMIVSDLRREGASWVSVSSGSVTGYPRTGWSNRWADHLGWEFSYEGLPDLSEALFNHPLDVGLAAATAYIQEELIPGAALLLAWLQWTAEWNATNTLIGSSVFRCIEDSLGGLFGYCSPRVDGQSEEPGGCLLGWPDPAPIWDHCSCLSGWRWKVANSHWTCSSHEAARELALAFEPCRWEARKERWGFGDDDGRDVRFEAEAALFEVVSALPNIAQTLLVLRDGIPPAKDRLEALRVRLVLVSHLQYAGAPLKGLGLDMMESTGELWDRVRARRSARARNR